MTKIKIGLFGFGVVGQGIYEVVRKSKNAHAEIVKICVRDPNVVNPFSSPVWPGCGSTTAA